MSERDDWESRLRDTLTEQAQEAPAAHGLADGARRRLRRRRTTGAVLAVAAVAVVVPLGLTWLSGSGEGSAPVADEPTASEPTASVSTATSDPSPDVDDGYRTESWKDVAFEVPADWALGSPTAWCLLGTDPQDVVPTVGRPTDVFVDVACEPTNGYGVSVGPAETYESGSGDVYRYRDPEVVPPRYPDGTWVSIWYDDEVAVTIATPDKALTERIVASVEHVEWFGEDE